MQRTFNHAQKACLCIRSGQLAAPFCRTFTLVVLVQVIPPLRRGEVGQALLLQLTAPHKLVQHLRAVEAGGG